MSPRIAALMASKNFEPLLDRLVSYLAAETEKADFLINREVLASIIVEAGMIYDGIRFQADLDSEKTFHEIDAPLALIIKILKHDANYDDVLIALGAPAMLAASSDQQAVSRAVERHDALLHHLDDIARAVPPPPAKRGRGRPPKTKDLRYLAEFLVNDWERQTGHPFKQYWHNGKPKNHATRFVRDVVEFIDPDRLIELPEITERIVTERRDATSVN